MSRLIAVFLLAASSIFCLEIPDNYVPVQGLVRPYHKVSYIPEPDVSRAIYWLPIQSVEGVNISQGPINERQGRTHSFYSCLYAADFLGSYDLEPGTILAARSGIVLDINAGCSADDSIHHADSCGDGFGNWIGILHKDGEISFYAHLAEIFAQQGKTVEAGEFIGIEGSTGQAGSRHLHFSVHRSDLYQEGRSFDLDNTLQEFSPPYHYPTVPYRLRYIEAKTAVQTTVDIRHFRNLDWDRNYSDEAKFLEVPTASNLIELELFTMNLNVLFHGSQTDNIGALEPRQRYTPGNEKGSPAGIYVTDNPAYAAAHSFPWSSDEGVDLYFERGEENGREYVVLEVPKEIETRMQQPVYIYTVKPDSFSPVVSDPVGHNYRSVESVDCIAKQVFESVTQAVEFHGGRVIIKE